MPEIAAAGGSTRIVQPLPALRNTHNSSQPSAGCTPPASVVPSRLSVSEPAQTMPNVHRFASAALTVRLASISTRQVSPGWRDSYERYVAVGAAAGVA